MPFNDHEVQVRTYCIILDKMGFDTRHLFHAIVLVNQEIRSDKELNKRVVKAVMNNGQKEAIIDIEKARIWVRKFRKDKAEKELDWAIDFWKNLRKSIPTKKVYKCKKCEYYKKCESSPLIRIKS